MIISAIPRETGLDAVGVRLLRRLDEAFQIRFDVWRLVAHGWMGAHDEPEYQALLNQCFATEQPVIMTLEPTRHLVGIRLPTTPTPAVAATAFETDSPHLLHCVANSLMREHRHLEEVRRLTQENHVVVSQVTVDFEEQCFVRSLTKSLTLSTSDVTLKELAQATFEELLRTLHCATLSLVSSIHSEGVYEVGAPLIVAGEASFNAEYIRQVVRSFRPSTTKPVVVNDFAERAEARNLPGLHSFIITPIEHKRHIYGWLVAVNCQAEPMNDPSGVLASFGTVQASLMEVVSAVLASHAKNIDLYQDLDQLLTNTVRTLVSAIEAKDRYTCGHSERVALYSKRLAKALGFSKEACDRVYLTGLVHDVGKIGVPETILRKESALTDEEFKAIQRHCDDGWSILAELRRLAYVLPGVVHHHERYDGAGYPDGLIGDAIPLEGRILAIADSYDAMTSNRPYRQGMPQQKAESILRDGAGKQWDPNMIRVFMDVMPDIVAIRDAFSGFERPVRTGSIASQMALPTGECE